MEEIYDPYVWCGTCCLRTRSCDSVADAITAWNTRAPAPSDQEKLADLLTKAVGDITAALTMAGKQGKIAAWTKPYVDALNEHDARARQPGAAS